MSRLQLKVVTPDRLFFEGEVDMVIIRGVEGDLAILKDHTPISTPLQIGSLRIFQDDQEMVAAVVQGYITVLDNNISIVTEAAEWPHEIDIERARKAKERAESLLEMHESEINYARALAALRRAINRISLSSLDKNNDNY